MACNLNEAIERGVAMVNAYDREFKELYDQRFLEVGKLEKEYQAAALQYIESLRNCIAASYVWQVKTPRYKHKNHFLSDLRI